MTATEAGQRRGYAAESELALRVALEAFCRERWPAARICHELVMGEGRTRADVVAIGEHHIAAFEVKGSYDEMTRLMHQVGMFQLCVPEVWMVVTENHHDDAKLLRHLLPSVGLLIAKGAGSDFASSTRRHRGEPVTLTVDAEAAPRAPHPYMTIRMLWAEEVRAACSALRITHGAKSTREHCVKQILALAKPEEILPVVCAQLRGRDALWRADPPVRDEAR